MAVRVCSLSLKRVYLPEDEPGIGARRSHLASRWGSGTGRSPTMLGVSGATSSDQHSPARPSALARPCPRTRRRYGRACRVGIASCLHSWPPKLVVVCSKCGEVRLPRPWQHSTARTNRTTRSASCSRNMCGFWFSRKGSSRPSSLTSGVESLN